LVLALVVHAADVQDRDGARRVFYQMRGRYPRLARIWADAGYSGTRLAGYARQWTRAALEIVNKKVGQTTFEVMPKRWIVERTFAWLGRYRRLSKDYEQNTASSAAWIYLAMTHMMVRRLA
jgi:putative transposase